MSNNKKNDDLDYETTGHEWDGIQEYNKPLPKWWLWTFYACIVWGIGYTIAYPAWPGISGATPGLLGFSTRANVEKAITDHEAELGPINDKLASVELTAIADDQELLQYANNAGGAIFRTWCAQCHGSGAAGAKGYPNLLDDDWLWGGSIEAIHETVSYGIRNEVNDMARWSQMPAFGRDELLVEEEVVQVVNYVMQLSGRRSRRRGLRHQLLGLPHGRRYRRPTPGCAEPDRPDLALRWRLRHPLRDGLQRAVRRDAPDGRRRPDRGRDPRRVGLCSRPGRGRSLGRVTARTRRHKAIPSPKGGGIFHARA